MHGTKAPSPNNHNKMCHIVSPMSDRKLRQRLSFLSSTNNGKEKAVITGSGLHLKQVKGGALIDRIFNFYMIFTVN